MGEVDHLVGWRPPFGLGDHGAYGVRVTADNMGVAWVAAVLVALPVKMVVARMLGRRRERLRVELSMKRFEERRIT